MKHLWVFTLGALVAGPGWAVTCQNNISASNPDAAYTDHHNGTVTDTRTGLMWKVCAEGQTWNGSGCDGTAIGMTWQAALAHAQDAQFPNGGHTDWRLPNLKELRSLVEECRTSPAINDSIFPQAPSSSFWSGSPYAGNSNFAWSVNFNNGNASYSNRYNNDSVRLVRGGQAFAAFSNTQPVAGNGQCGAANGVESATAPTVQQCAAGAASTVSRLGVSEWQWSCAGSNGGVTAQCAAPLPASVVNGTCGPAHDLLTIARPEGNLCATGIASNVSGSGPWSWSCAGSGAGATTANCTAPPVPPVQPVPGQPGQPGQPDPAIQPIPTLQEWAMVLMALLLAASAMATGRRRED